MKPKPVPASKGVDPLDDILSGLGGSSSTPASKPKPAPAAAKKDPLDDIDALLADGVGGGSSSKSSATARTSSSPSFVFASCLSCPIVSHALYRD